MSWAVEKFRLRALAREVEPVAVVQTKDGWWWTALYVFGAVLSLGILLAVISKSAFLERYATALATLQGYPKEWRTVSERTVLHESRHTTQCVVLGYFAAAGAVAAVAATCWPSTVLGAVPLAAATAVASVALISRAFRAWLGLPLFGIAYVLPLPVGLALGRLLLEADADRVAYLGALERGYLSVEGMKAHARGRVDSLSGRAYFYAVPNCVARWVYAYVVAKTEVVYLERRSRRVVADAARRLRGDE